MNPTRDDIKRLLSFMLEDFVNKVRFYTERGLKLKILKKIDSSKKMMIHISLMNNEID